MRRYLVIAVALLTLLALAVPVAAITDGEPTTDHPEVVLILMEVDGEPAYRCSGALMSSTIVLTAGHCAGAPGEFSGLRIFTEADVEAGRGITNNYPYGDEAPNPDTGVVVPDTLKTIEVVRWAAHPDYPNYPFYFNDVGVLELAQEFVLDEYAELPGIDKLDEYAKKRGQNKVIFNAVGYGLQASSPVPSHNMAERTRYEAFPKLNAINAPGFTGDFSLLLSNNHQTGGTCFGDSGGPNYLDGTLIVAGVTSFGLNGNCAGTGGVFRMDRQNVQDFISDFIAEP